MPFMPFSAFMPEIQEIIGNVIRVLAKVLHISRNRITFLSFEAFVSFCPFLAYGNK
jgi:hypothetical protein